VKNVQVAYAYGTSVIRGEVQVRGGARPEGVRYLVRASRPESGGTGGGADELDSLGRFRIENLSAGEYELVLFDWPPKTANPSPLAKLSVTVPAEGEVKVTLVYDMGAKREGQ
jgi:hypothetical protein